MNGRTLFVLRGRGINKLFIILLIMLSIPACCIHNPCKNIDETSVIEKTVLLFAETYGTARMDEAAAITTAHFRDGMPGTVWVAAVWPKLEKLEYKKLKTEILSTKIDEDKAVVVAQAEISTAGATAAQKEIYCLIRLQGRWLVDELEVLEDDVESIRTDI